MAFAGSEQIDYGHVSGYRDYCDGVSRGVRVSHGVRLGRGVRVSHGVRLGRGVRLGHDTRMGA
jgi:acetyltransferase-like isoleucine patch superfamily enzyme